MAVDGSKMSAAIVQVGLSLVLKVNCQLANTYLIGYVWARSSVSHCVYR